MLKYFNFFFLSALEESRRSGQSSALHMGRYLPPDPLSPGEGPPVLPLPQLHRVRRQGAAARLPRGVRLPEERASLLHPLHRRTLLLHRPACPADAPVPRVDGRGRAHPGQLVDDALQLPDGESRRSHSEFFHSNDFENMKLQSRRFYMKSENCIRFQCHQQTVEFQSDVFSGLMANVYLHQQQPYPKIASSRDFSMILKPRIIFF